MSQILYEVFSANQTYAESFGEKSALALPPARRFAILSCMDAGLREGDARVIRNAGGVSCGSKPQCESASTSDRTLQTIAEISRQPTSLVSGV